MKTSRIFFISIIIIIFCVTAHASKLYNERIYEPVVLRGEILAPFFTVPINEIYMYAYRESTQTWEMMPFQVDEMIYAEDPFKQGNEDAWQDFYFIPDDSLLDFRDELVFMVRDLGDKASENNWIDNREANAFQRLEIAVSDPNDSNIKAYGYLFRSATIAEEVPTPYNFFFDPYNHIAESKYYSVRISKHSGLIEDVIIKPPFGSGVDIFDTQKLRFVGVFDFGIFSIAIGKSGYPAANERDNLYLYDYLEYTKKPVVRLIREVRHTIRFGDFHLDDTAFYVKTKFYPYSGTIAGGANLDPEQLKEEFDIDEDIYVNLDLLRQSWDFNAEAAGMKFFNKYNENILIDGIPDQLDKRIDAPVKEWTLVTGNQGSMFTYVEFDDTTWQTTELYFYDNLAGGQGDSTPIYGDDTGDSVSYGDHGILFKNLENDKVSLKLGFTAYFLPGNLNKSDGEKLSYQAENPVVVSSSACTYPVDVRQQLNNNPANFSLRQNYPNPFNNSTKIVFEIPAAAHITVKILDINGRIVVILADDLLAAGIHELKWNGANRQNLKVASGVYFYEIHSEKYSFVKKMILLQ